MIGAEPRPLKLAGTTEGTRRLVVRVGWGLIALQLVGLMWWSSRVEHDVGLSWDFMTYYQAFWAIAHGHLNPSTTMMPGLYKTFPFWQQDGEFLVWLLAPFYWLFPNHQLGFWWLQDLAIAGISAVCFRWICELVPWEKERSWRENDRALVSWMLVLCLLLVNPWIYWSATFAIHLEPFGALFALLTLRALTQQRRTVWLWAALTLLCGSAEVIYLISAGLAASAFWAMRWRAARQANLDRVAEDARALRRAAATTSAGVIWMLALSAAHGTRAVTSPWAVVHSDLRYLMGNGKSKLAIVHAAEQALLHPLSVASTIGSHWLNLWANVSPGGVIGLISIPGFFMSVPTLLENSLLRGQNFSYPGFFNLIVYPAMAVGTTLVVAGMLQRKRRIGMLLAAVAAVNVVVWCAVWLPKTGTAFLRTSPAAARTIRLAAKQIPTSAEVISSQGFVGAFADRLDIHVFGGPQDVLAGPELFPVDARSVWFVLSASQGIEVPSTTATDRAIASVAALPNAKLVRYVDGVWIFRWTPPPDTHTVAIGSPETPVPGWATAGTAGSPRLTGSPRAWTLVSTGAEGYVVSGDIWLLQPGRYVAGVTLRDSSRTNVEIWSDQSSGDRLLARRVLSAAPTRTLRIPFAVDAVGSPPSWTGPFPFAYTPIPPSAAANIEVRIWTPGRGSAVSVRTIRIHAAPRA